MQLAKKYTHTETVSAPTALLAGTVIFAYPSVANDERVVVVVSSECLTATTSSDG